MTKTLYRPKKIGKIILYSLLSLLAIPIFYLLIALFLSYIPVNSADSGAEKTIYLGTNGVHLDIIVPISELDPDLVKDLQYQESDSFLAFGWGDENFYLNTPTWGDLTIDRAVHALFLDNTTLVHLGPYPSRGRNWVAVQVNQQQLSAVQAYLKQSFQLNDRNEKMRIEGHTYGYGDSFYKARGNYSFRKTCNTWVNNGLQESGLPACYWTPFDFTVLSRYN